MLKITFQTMTVRDNNLGKNEEVDYLYYLKGLVKKAAAGGKNVPLFHHRTNATDTQSMKKVIADVK